MKANRKVMLGAALVVAIVALAGVGYAAATGYKATMQVTGNSVGPSEYIFISEKDGNYTGAFTGTYAFDTETTWNDAIETPAAYVQYSNCQKISTDGMDPVTTDKFFKYTPGAGEAAGTFAVATSDGDYDGILVGKITVTFTKATSTATEFHMAVTAPTLSDLVQPNNISIVFTMTKPGSNEAVVDLSNVGDIVLTATSDVVFKAYLAVADAGVPLASAIGGTSATLSGVNLTFTVTAGPTS